MADSNPEPLLVRLNVEHVGADSNPEYTLRLSAFWVSVPTDPENISLKVGPSQRELPLAHDGAGLFSVHYTKDLADAVSNYISFWASARLAGFSGSHSAGISGNPLPFGTGGNVSCRTFVENWNQTGGEYDPGDTVALRIETRLNGSLADIAPVTVNLSISDGVGPYASMAHEVKQADRVGPGLFRWSYTVPLDLTSTHSYSMWVTTGDQNYTCYEIFGFRVNFLNVTAFIGDLTNSSARISVLVGNLTDPLGGAQVTVVGFVDNPGSLEETAVLLGSGRTDRWGLYAANLTLGRWSPRSFLINASYANRTTKMELNRPTWPHSDPSREMGQPSAAGFEIIPLTDTRKMYPGDLVTLRFRAFQDGTPLENATISRLLLRQETEVLAFGNVTTDGLGDFSFEHAVHGGWEQLHICAWNATWHRAWASLYFSGERYQEPPSERIRITIDPQPLGEPMHFHVSLDSNVPVGAEAYFQLYLTPTTDIRTDLGTYWARDLVSGTLPWVFYETNSTKVDGNITVPYWFPEGTYAVVASFMILPNASIGAEYLTDWNSTTVQLAPSNRLPPSIPDPNGGEQPTQGFTTTFMPGLQTAAIVVAVAVSRQAARRRRAP